MASAHCSGAQYMLIDSKAIYWQQCSSIKASKNYNLGLLHITVSILLSLWEDSLFIYIEEISG